MTEDIPKCCKCKRDATRYYNGKHLCELHYLKANPKRNRRLVDWDKLRGMRMITEDILFFTKQKNIYEKEIE